MPFVIPAAEHMPHGGVLNSHCVLSCAAKTDLAHTTQTLQHTT